MVKNTILFVVSHQGYQPVEYFVPKKLLEQAGFHIVTASDQEGVATANDDSTTPVDILIQEANSNDYDGIFFIGGPGALEHLDNEHSYKLISSAVENKKIVGAICVSTRILAHAQALKNKRATGWNGDNALGGIYKEYDVQYVPKDVVVDGLIITATGPSVAREFGEQIITLLQG
jgi:protease I